MPNYRYKGMGGRLAFLAGAAALGVTIAVVSVRRGQFTPALAMFLLAYALVFGAFFFVAGILWSSDIALDEQRISRVLFGHCWQAIPWGQVALVRVVWLRDPQYQRRVRAFYVHRSGDLRSWGWPGQGRIFFRETVENAQDLLEQLNHYIRLHRIPVESVQDGVKTASDHV